MDWMDQTTFNQILELDEDDDREFSRDIVVNYLQQSQETIEKMKHSL
jgi:osomolarity two-component system, phosphorelay intermediate protein YPD1